MCSSEDIQVLIIDYEADNMPGRTRWHLRTVEGYREIGNTYIYHRNGLLNSLYYDWPKTYIETASFQKNGIMENYMYVFDVSNGYKSYYSHSWRPSGFTAATHWWIDRKDRHTANEYDKEGRLRVKKVYKADGEKDYVLVYWYGSPIPYTEDGFLKKGRI
jgi:hypothetical protein